MLSRISLYLLMAAVALAPLPQGSVDVEWMAVWASVLGLSLAFSPTRQLRRVHFGLIAPAVVFIALYAGTSWFQTLPTAAAAHPIWGITERLLQTDLVERVSVNAYVPWAALGVPFLGFLSFLSGFLNGVDRAGALLLLRLCAVAGTVCAMGAMSQYAGMPIFSDLHTGSPLSAPFVNRNHAATYYGSCSVLWFVLGISELTRQFEEARGAPAEMGRALLQDSPWTLVVSVAGFLICLTATFLTLSRAGVLLTLCTLLVCGSFSAYRTLSGHPRFPLLAGGAVLLSVLFLEVWGGGLAYRIAGAGLVDVGRQEVYRGTVELIREHPLGTGLASFETVFPAYRSNAITTRLVWDHAHSTPLELTAELGLPLTIVAVAVWLFGAVCLVRAVIRRRDALIPLCAFGIGMFGTTHSFFDFPLQIPAFAIVFSAIVGAGLAQSVRPSPSGRRPLGIAPAVDA